MAIQINSQTPDQPTDWNGSVTQYLSKHGIEVDKATPLSGGASAYLWKLDGYRDTKSSENGVKHEQPRVMKCADSKIKAVPDMEAPVDRMSTEIKAMESEVVAEACRREPSVQVSKLLRKTENGFVMEWAGDIDLRQAFKKDDSLDYQDIGSRVGRWLAFMHQAGIPNHEHWDTHCDMLKPLHKAGGMMEQSIRSTLEANHFTEEDTSRAISRLRTESGVRTLVAHDFRPMNTLLRKHEQSRPDITIVDFECCHYTDPAWDIKSWVAEGMVLEAKYGNRGLLSSFLTAYKQHAGDQIVNAQFVYRTVIAAAGMWLILMPAEIWDCTGEDVKPWTETAVRYIRAAVEQDIEWLKESAVGPLLK